MGRLRSALLVLLVILLSLADVYNAVCAGIQLASSGKAPDIARLLHESILLVKSVADVVFLSLLLFRKRVGFYGYAVMTVVGIALNVRIYGSLLGGVLHGSLAIIVISCLVFLPPSDRLWKRMT